MPVNYAGISFVAGTRLLYFSWYFLYFLYKLYRVFLLCLCVIQRISCKFAQQREIDKCKSIKQALFYINKTIENNWSRAVLEYKIETDVNNPIGVSTFHYTELASDIKSVLPSAEDLQHELLNFEHEHKRDV